MNLTVNIFLSFSYLLVNKLINNYIILKYRHNKYSTVVIPPCEASKIQPEEQTLRKSTNDKALVESPEARHLSFKSHKRINAFK